MSVVKNLNKNLGGNWKYLQCGDWWVDKESDRTIHAVASVNEFDEVERGSVRYHLYGDGKPQRAEKFMGHEYFKRKN